MHAPSNCFRGFSVNRAGAGRSESLHRFRKPGIMTEKKYSSFSDDMEKIRSSLGEIAQEMEELQKEPASSDARLQELLNLLRKDIAELQKLCEPPAR